MLALLALLSGATSLAYEVLYVRALTTVLGDMYYIHAALLASFLIGIGLGARWAWRCRRWLFLIELGIGSYALLFPHLIGTYGETRLAAFINQVPAWAVGVTIVSMALPSVLVGFSIPLFSDYLKQTTRRGRSFQRVYGIYNLGALVSILVAEFVLVRHLGITRALALVGAVNLAIGATLWVSRVGGGESSKPAPTGRPFPARIRAAVIMASFGSAVFQMFLLKLCYLVFEPHRENFAITVALSMAGVALGTVLASRFRWRFSLVLVAIPVVLGITFLIYLPLLAGVEATAEWARSSPFLVFLRKLLAMGAFGFPALCLYGALLPSLMHEEQAVARESGELLFLSSMANAAGYLAWVLLLHPVLPVGWILGGIAATAWVAGLLSLPDRGGWGVRTAVVCGLLLSLAIPSTFRERNFYLAQWASTLKPEDEVRVFKSGAESATLLRNDDYDWISYNGHNSIYVSRNGIVSFSEITSGVIAALNAPRLERALVLGFGTGMTGGTVAQYFRRCDIVEINEAFFEMQCELTYANMNVAGRASARLHAGDGRMFLSATEGVYDVIVNSIPAPTYFSASKIYTVEFYERVARALKPDGVFLTWLSVHNMSESGIAMILSALRRVFPYCELRLLRGSYYMATCSKTPLQSRSFDALPSRPEVVRILESNFPEIDLDHYFAVTRLSPDIFARPLPMDPPVRENRDDFPALEFHLVDRYQTGRQGDDPFLQYASEFGIDPGRHIDSENRVASLEVLALYRRLSPPLFDRFLVPLLERDAELSAAWHAHIEPED